VHPIAFQYGSFVVHWYGVLVACGFLAGIWMTAWRARQQNIPTELVFDLSLYLLIFGMLGGKLFYLIAYWNDFHHNFSREGFNALRSGFVFYGGFICAVVVTIWYARRHGIQHWRMADLFTPALPLGHAFGRLGCFAEGCCYGEHSALPWPCTILRRIRRIPTERIRRSSTKPPPTSLSVPCCRGSIRAVSLTAKCSGSTRFSTL
jgi:phosphatidylglycerol:prolipoprotein diacylglycerol transferase